MAAFCLLGPVMTAERMAYVGAIAVAFVLFSTLQPIPVVTGFLLLTVIRPAVTLVREQLLADVAATAFRFRSEANRHTPESDRAKTGLSSETELLEADVNGLHRN